MKTPHDFASRKSLRGLFAKTEPSAQLAFGEVVAGLSSKFEAVQFLKYRPSSFPLCALDFNKHA